MTLKLLQVARVSIETMQKTKVSVKLAKACRGNLNI